jgi:hypothetical protein
LEEKKKVCENNCTMIDKSGSLPENMEDCYEEIWKFPDLTQKHIAKSFWMIKRKSENTPFSNWRQSGSRPENMEDHQGGIWNCSR